MDIEDADVLEDVEPTRAKTEARGTLFGGDAARVNRRASKVCPAECARCVGAMMVGQMAVAEGRC